MKCRSGKITGTDKIKQEASENRDPFFGSRTNEGWRDTPVPLSQTTTFLLSMMRQLCDDDFLQTLELIESAVS
jgi:hypothetical protein